MAGTKKTQEYKWKWKQKENRFTNVPLFCKSSSGLSRRLNIIIFKTFIEIYLQSCFYQNQFSLVLVKCGCKLELASN